MRIKIEDQKNLTIVLAAYIDNIDMWMKMAEKSKNMPEPIKENMKKMRGFGEDLLSKYGQKESLEEYKACNNWKKDLV